jgi:glycerate 2-kinase
VRATARMLELLATCGPEDFVLALISGGGSALLIHPADGITLAEKQALTQALLASGAPIGEINGIRKEISAVKGGRLAVAAIRRGCWRCSSRMCPATTRAISPAARRWGIPAMRPGRLRRCALGRHPPPSIRAFLEAGGDPVRPDDPRLDRVENVIVAAPSQSLPAAADLARRRATRRVLGDAIEGEARDVARACRRCPGGQRAARDPVGRRADGDAAGRRHRRSERGIRAGAGEALDGAPGIHAIACDTDGVDGAAEVAGALIGPDTLAKARAAGLDAKPRAVRNDAHSFFAAIGGQVVTGPTLTNVNDFRAILIAPPT